MNQRLVLVVEDNPGDADLLEAAFETAARPPQLLVQPTGEEARSHLEAGIAGSARLPDLILLDLNLPGMSGLELLRWLKAGRLKRIPVLMLSSSGAQHEVDACYDAGANAYLRKPMGMSELRELVDSFVTFWLRRVERPRVTESPV